MIEPAIAFCVREHDDPALEVRVNFGIFAGRQATPAEIDDLARALHDELASFTIVAEERHQFGGVVETSVHQVVVEVERELDRSDIAVVCERVVGIADQWVGDCTASRHMDVADL
jgi:hypothetical protein